MVGAFFAAPCAYDHVPSLRPARSSLPSSRDRFGRRAGMFVGGVIICIGTIVMSTSFIANQFIAGRFIVGFGISFMITAGPTYVAEIAPPQWRGRFTASSSCEIIFRSIGELL